LQGKERDYIFYFWDINRHNVAAFRQGDDADKRKGELNVLMSRPRKRAYHYVHKDFLNLDPTKATIIDFLRQVQEQQGSREKKRGFLPRKQKPGKQFIPWRRSSGQLMRSLLQPFFDQAAFEAWPCDFGVVVGDAKRRVDLVFLNQDSKGEAAHMALVDLAAFEPHAHLAQDVIDYYFQLCRAKPRMQPFFLFIHELLDEQHPMRLHLQDFLGWDERRQLKKPS
jgi:hypothetical protein